MKAAKNVLKTHKHNGMASQVGQEIEKLSKQYPIVIPPWFGLIIRAFSTIEGIGLQLDSDYAIVDECFPYMAKRLLTDPNPRIRAALRTFVYGGADQLNVSRVEDMLSGFQNFTLTTKAVSQVQRIFNALLVNRAKTFLCAGERETSREWPLLVGSTPWEDWILSQKRWSTSYSTHAETTCKSYSWKKLSERQTPSSRKEQAL